jgi:hypothetical protein
MGFSLENRPLRSLRLCGSIVFSSPCGAMQSHGQLPKYSSEEGLTAAFAHMLKLFVSLISLESNF